MAKRQKLNVGDVFVIPTHDGRVGVGQVVGLGEQPQLFYFAVFEEVLPEGSSSEQMIAATRSPVLFLGMSVTAKFTAGHWSVVGSAPISDHVKLPAYKVSVGFPSSWEVVDYSGSRRRPATDLEADLLPYRRVVSPMYFEVALRAHLGLDDWNDAFDTLKPQGGVSSADLFGGPIEQ